MIQFIHKQSIAIMNCESERLFEVPDIFLVLLENLLEYPRPQMSQRPTFFYYTFIQQICPHLFYPAQFWSLCTQAKASSSHTDSVSSKSIVSLCLGCSKNSWLVICTSSIFNMQGSGDWTHATFQHNSHSFVWQLPLWSKARKLWRRWQLFSMSSLVDGVKGHEKCLWQLKKHLGP